MRIGLLSDIHGNAAALEAVLAHAASRHVARWLNLGDVYYGPLEPSKTLRLLSSLESVTVRGNQDRQICDATAAELVVNPTLTHVHRELGNSVIETLAAFPSSALLEYGVFACHGSPKDDGEYLLEEVSTGVPRIRSESELEALVEGVPADVIVCGHTHLPRVVQLQIGTLIVNPGSVGLPAYSDDTPNYHCMETHSPNAAYAIIEHSEGQWCVEQYSVPYDFARSVRKALGLGRVDWAHWLRSGRCPAAGSR